MEKDCFVKYKKYIVLMYFRAWNTSELDETGQGNEEWNILISNKGFANDRFAVLARNKKVLLIESEKDVAMELEQCNRTDKLLQKDNFAGNPRLLQEYPLMTIRNWSVIARPF